MNYKIGLTISKRKYQKYCGSCPCLSASTKSGQFLVIQSVWLKISLFMKIKTQIHDYWFRSFEMFTKSENQFWNSFLRIYLQNRQSRIVLISNKNHKLGSRCRIRWTEYLRQSITSMHSTENSDNPTIDPYILLNSIRVHK